MTFLRFKAKSHEWGFDVPDGFIPAVGDTVTLWHAMPDDTEGDTEDAIDGVVTKRRWGFASEDCVELEVELEDELPEGHVADSTEWHRFQWQRLRPPPVQSKPTAAWFQTIVRRLFVET
jgi:hypothetical protein